MGKFDLNLSTQPFPAYQVKTLLLTLGLIVLGALSAWQAYGFIQYSKLAGQIRGEAQGAQVEAEALARRLADMELKLSRPEAMQKLNEIAFLNDIIARKSFSWTRIFANLEKLMPDDVHLVSLRPNFLDTGEVRLDIDVRGRSMADIKQLIEALQSHSAFGLVQVDTETKKDAGPNMASGDLAVTLRVPYHQERESQ